MADRSVSIDLSLSIVPRMMTALVVAVVAGIGGCLDFVVSGVHMPAEGRRKQCRQHYREKYPRHEI